MKKFITLLASAGVAAVASTAQAAEVELSLSHWLAPQHPLHPTGIEPWVKAISDASEGRIHITIYPSQQLGASADHYDMARDGVADITFVSPGYQPGRFPIISAAEIPFTVSNAKGGTRAFDEWYRPYAAKEMGDVYFCMAHLHDPGVLHAKDGPLRVPSDLAGKAVRPPHGTMARLVNSVGGASVFGSAPEMREMVARGTADVLPVMWGAVFTFGIQDLLKYHLDMPLYTSTFVWVFNKDVVDGLSPENRKVIDDHCTSEWAEKVASPWADNEASGRQRMIDAGGHTLYAPTPEEVQLWQDAARPLLQEWKAAVAAVGIDADATWANFEETLKKYDSQFK